MVAVIVVDNLTLWLGSMTTVLLGWFSPMASARAKVKVLRSLDRARSCVLVGHQQPSVFQQDGVTDAQLDHGPCRVLMRSKRPLTSSWSSSAITSVVAGPLQRSNAMGRWSIAPGFLPSASVSVRSTSTNPSV